MASLARTLVVVVVVVVLAAAPRVAHATFSIVACDKDQTCGAAVATNNLAVGATVIYAQAGVGALATQFETNPSYGAKGLAMLARGQAPQATLDELLRTDGNFEGEDISARQVGIVAADGKTAGYTGAQAAASPWAGILAGAGFRVQGNGLAGRAVLDAMKAAYLQTAGPLEDRLIAALAAGEAAGGQTTGRMSAAIVVRTRAGGFADLDLRVDAADQLRLGAGWDRIWRRAARLEIQIGDTSAALQALAGLMHVNPVWGKLELDDPIYRALWTQPIVQRWRAPAPSRRP
jgi:uncharacterized Ntn-hydrolase superfamily protein